MSSSIWPPEGSGGGGSGITSINSDTTAAQIITGSGGVTASTVSGTTTIAITGGTYLPVNNPTYTGLLSTVAGTLTIKGYHVDPDETDDGNSGTAQTTNWALNSAHKSTLTGNCVYTFSNPVTAAPYILRIYTGAGGFTTTLPASVKYLDSQGAPDTTTAAKMFLFSFYYDGTNYWASYGVYTP